MTDRLEQVVLSHEAHETATRLYKLWNQLKEEEESLRQKQAAEIMPTLWAELKQHIKGDCEKNEKTFKFHSMDENALRVYCEKNFVNLKVSFDPQQGTITTSCLTTDHPEAEEWNSQFSFGLYNARPFLYRTEKGEKKGPYNPYSVSGELLERTLSTGK